MYTSYFIFSGPSTTEMINGPTLTSQTTLECISTAVYAVNNNFAWIQARHSLDGRVGWFNAGVCHCVIHACGCGIVVLLIHFLGTLDQRYFVWGACVGYAPEPATLLPCPAQRMCVNAGMCLHTCFAVAAVNEALQMSLSATFFLCTWLLSKRIMTCFVLTFDLHHT